MKPNYSDIIGRERPTHKNDDFDIRHPKMRRQLRAKQFAPFDALEGFQETVEEHQAVTVRPKTLSEGKREGINETLLQIQERFLAWKRDRKRGVQENTPVRVSVTFFKRDKRQEAIHADGIRGDTVRLDGDVTAFDAVSQALRVSGVLILFSDIYEIDVEL